MSLPQFFHEYHSIKSGPSAVKPRTLSQQKHSVFIVLEKIHGSNFGFMCNEKEIVCCRRTAALDPNETFHNFQEIREKYSANIRQLWMKILNTTFIFEDQPETRPLHHFTIYGELYGGVYPHPEVLDKGNQPIQKGVYYSPDHNFIAFDLELSYSEHPVEKQKAQRLFVNYDLVVELLDECGIPILKPLFRGTREECLKYNIKHNSTIPALFQLPTLETNLIEGIIVKPVEPVVVTEFQHRLIAKIKNPKFEETNPKCETLWEQRRNKIKGLMEFYIQDLERYLTENRKNNLESKIGPINQENISQATELFVQDVICDFTSDIESNSDPDFEKPSPEQLENIFKSLPSRARYFLLNSGK
eukprot:TRINITY_DN5363_c0_g1_i1.p1 TRINITY_DN5363_c0_g1~~TRINITY_DN5363_c0_g1_i1.p1  ORF type:complete len:366 (+),score=63.68 TRINITY_DN5363_c0_g1_i1:22-1098(+)